mgnify:CR=1 FL=1
MLKNVKMPMKAFFHPIVRSFDEYVLELMVERM